MFKKSYQLFIKETFLPLTSGLVTLLFCQTKNKNFKVVEILDKMDPEGTSVYAPNIIGKYENRPDDLDDVCN